MTKYGISKVVQSLDDPEEGVYQSVYAYLKSCGEQVIPYLEEARMSSSNIQFSTRLDGLIDEIRFAGIYESCRKSARKNIFEILLLLSKYHNSGFNERSARVCFDQIKRDIWLELNERLTTFEQVKIANYILFRVYRIRVIENAAPGHELFVDHLLNCREAHPSLLWLFYVSILQEMDISVRGLEWEGRFLVGFYSRFINGFLFYADPADPDGVFVPDNGFSPRKTGFFTNRGMAAEYMDQIISAYLSQEKKQKAGNLLLLRDLFTDEKTFLLS